MINITDLSSVYEIFLKVILVIGYLLYLIFSFLMLKQTFTMASTLRTGVSPIIKLIAVINMVIALGLLLYAVFLV